jgi:hypothetical protein
LLQCGADLVFRYQSDSYIFRSELNCPITLHGCS